MSLLKWKELAKSKSELGDKINTVRNAIIRNDLSQKTSQASFTTVFQSITTKLDGFITSNLKMPPTKRRPLKKGEVPNYGIDIEDEVQDMNLDDLFDETVLPQQEKQIVPKPPTYEKSLQDILSGNREIYVDPQYFPETQDLHPEYEEEEDEVDYVLDDEDMDNEILNDLGIQNYDSVDKILNQQEMTQQQKQNILIRLLMMHKSLSQNNLKVVSFRKLQDKWKIKE